MKKLLLAACLVASPLAFAEIQWAEKPVKFEEIRHQSVGDVNLAIRKAGGLERLIEDSKQGDAHSLFIMSRMYQYGIVKEQDLNESVELLERSAAKNHTDAIFRLGMIMLGKDPIIGEDRGFMNKAQGIEMVTQAAEAGIAEAQYMVGLYYIEGELLTEDRDLGLFWLTKARDKGYGPASQARTEILNSSRLRNLSFDYVQQRAIEGNPDFLVKLASFYEDGWVVQKDRKKSIRLLKTAAELGSSNAIDLLQEKGIKH